MVVALRSLIAALQGRLNLIAGSTSTTGLREDNCHQTRSSLEEWR